MAECAIEFEASPNFERYYERVAQISIAITTVIEQTAGVLTVGMDSYALVTIEENAYLQINVISWENNMVVDVTGMKWSICF